MVARTTDFRKCEAISLMSDVMSVVKTDWMNKIASLIDCQKVFSRLLSHLIFLIRDRNGFSLLPKQIFV